MEILLYMKRNKKILTLSKAIISINKGKKTMATQIKRELLKVTNQHLIVNIFLVDLNIKTNIKKA